VDAVLRTPKDVLALGHRVTTEQDGLELTFRDPMFGETVLGMATHGHISDARDVRVVVLHRRFPGPMDPRPASGGYLPTRLRRVKSRRNTATGTESKVHMVKNL